MKQAALSPLNLHSRIKPHLNQAMTSSGTGIPSSEKTTSLQMSQTTSRSASATSSRRSRKLSRDESAVPLMEGAVRITSLYFSPTDTCVLFTLVWGIRQTQNII
ncbi:Hypothetical_protein [Hexamita inflata]|uniref:Hypothetical_protein n=1 Tax=Hexamita inflata TaxID=28002 RepID=A0AA86RGY4_9EUKA|nr:Hypothetical protein HINF_LOCUS65345 [Hexamita inflata]